MARSWFNLDHPQIIADCTRMIIANRGNVVCATFFVGRSLLRAASRHIRARPTLQTCMPNAACGCALARARRLPVGGERRTRSHFGVPYGEVYGDDCRQCPLGYGYGTSPHCGHWTRSSNDGGAETNVARGNGAAAIGAVPFSSSSSSSPPSSSSPSSSSALSPLPQPLS